MRLLNLYWTRPLNISHEVTSFIPIQLCCPALRCKYDTDVTVYCDGGGREREGEREGERGERESGRWRGERTREGGGEGREREREEEMGEREEATGENERSEEHTSELQSR